MFTAVPFSLATHTDPKQNKTQLFDTQVLGRVIMEHLCSELCTVVRTDGRHHVYLPTENQMTSSLRNKRTSSSWRILEVVLGGAVMGPFYFFASLFTFLCIKVHVFLFF